MRLDAGEVLVGRVDADEVLAGDVQEHGQAGAHAQKDGVEAVSSSSSTVSERPMTELTSILTPRRSR